MKWKIVGVKKQHSFPLHIFNQQFYIYIPLVGVAVVLFVVVIRPFSGRRK